MADALQIWVMVCAPGQVNRTVQSFSGTAPEFVTVKPSWNPPDHELVTDQVTVHPVPAVGEAEADGEDDGDAEGDGDAECDGDAEGETLADGDADGEADGDGDGDGALPLPPERTTIDSAGTDTDDPLNEDVAIEGDAAEYVYEVSDELVNPSDDTGTEYPEDGFAFTSITEYDPPGSTE